MAFKLPDLPYAYDALKTHFDARTMKIHHTKHHAGYTNKLNAAIEGTDHAGKSIEDLMKIASTNAAIRNSGGGYYNHSLFWKILSPEGETFPATGKFGKAFAAKFKDMDKFKEEFKNAASSRFGSGWAWLCVNNRGALFITSSPNQDNPLMDCAEKKGKPILGLDVWEHAYYLKYQNRRGDYIDAFFEIVNWKQVAKNYNAAIKPKKKAVKKVAKKVVAAAVAKKAIAKKAAAKKAAPKKVVAAKTAAPKTEAAPKRRGRPAKKK